VPGSASRLSGGRVFNDVVNFGSVSRHYLNFGPGSGEHVTRRIGTTRSSLGADNNRGSKTDEQRECFVCHCIPLEPKFMRMLARPLSVECQFGAKAGAVRSDQASPGSDCRESPCFRRTSRDGADSDKAESFPA
jgi:hypothetical protein